MVFPLLSLKHSFNKAGGVVKDVVMRGDEPFKKLGDLVLKKCNAIEMDVSKD
jgi:hypothetical protein